MEVKMLEQKKKVSLCGPIGKLNRVEDDQNRSVAAFDAVQRFFPRDSKWRARTRQCNENWVKILNENHKLWQKKKINCNDVYHVQVV